jgi:cellulose synthase/poly-beta-1,6-N-acetylglucosamine synthase-like glycosyltransferase
MISSLALIGQLVLAAFGVATLLVSVQLILFFPLTVAYEFWKRRALRRLLGAPFQGRVTVIVPAYNEEKTLRVCVESLLASRYSDLEIIVVNDGSTDGTARCIDDLVDGERVRYLYQANGGKATALNRGAAAASGEIILYTDADSLFLPDTVGQMVRWFGDPTVHAVCGNDTPLTARTPLQRILAVTSHIGTGFVRRALSLLNVLPIISGNLGAVRADTFREIGGFLQVWGEDLEFTFRLQSAGKRIVFDPSPIVRAECPADLPSLWRQRLRWVRSYLKVSAMHSGLFRPTRAFPFSLYLPFNYLAQTAVPLLQILALPFLFRLTFAGSNSWDWAWMLVLYFGLVTFLAVALYSILLDRDFRTLKHIPFAALLIIPLSYFYSFVVLSSVWKELLGRAERWEKIERLPEGAMGRRGGFSLVLMAVLLVGAVGAVRISHTSSVSPPLPQPPVPRRPPSDMVWADDGRIHDIAIATHFDGWQDWRIAITSVLQNPVAPRLHTIGISAGRVEWAHFRWQGHPTQWSSLQKRASVDMLGEAIRDFNKHGLRTVAMVDFYSPDLVKRSPEKAAIRFDGMRSTDQVCFSELVDGAYGQQIIEMVSYLSHNYPLDAIALTELGYYSFCFDDRCLRSYHDGTGQAAWPRKRLGGGIDRDDPSVWEWRSERMKLFLRKVADAAHSGGKRLIVDVPVSWKDLRRHGKDSGLDYARVLQNADQIVVWNYFGVEQKSPEVSQHVVEDLLQDFPPGKFFVSIGLWRPNGILDPQAFQKGLAYSMKSGAPNIWITPNELMSRAHWAAVDAALRETDARMHAHN